jgi:hypothetical protein
MNTLGLALLGIVMGIMAHQTNRYIEHMERHIAIKRATRYTCGVLFVMPLFLFAVWLIMGLTGLQIFQMATLYLLSFAFIGLGVLFGYWLDGR